MIEFQRNTKLMGSSFSLGVLAKNKTHANKIIDLGIEEIKRIEHLLSEFLSSSDASKINLHTKTTPLLIQAETKDLLKRCHAISKLTNGDFDITVSPLKKLYQFKNKEFTYPSNHQIKEVLNKVGYTKINLNEVGSNISLNISDVKISFAAVGKGYAADCVKKRWLEEGIESGFINASGDLNAWGKKEDGSPWKVSIANPEDKGKMLFYVPINNSAVATSGDYEQYFVYKGNRYSHNINPHTGHPLSGVKSVSVFSPSAELSDALATAVYVKGVKKGIDFMNQLPNTHCIIIDDKNQVYFSKKMNYEETIL